MLIGDGDRVRRLAVARTLHNAGFDVTYEFVGIESINGSTPGEGALNDFPPPDASGMITWDIGTVVTESEDDVAVQSVTPTVRIRYHARINNDLVTDAGDTTIR